MVSLYAENSLENFWKLVTPFGEDIWREAVMLAIQSLDIPCQDHDQVLNWSLGESNYGHSNWRLSVPKQLYYCLKPMIPQFVSKHLRRILCAGKQNHYKDHLFWPIDNRLMNYLWMVLTMAMDLTGKQELQMIGFWPDHKKTAFVLTHDVETEFGQSHVEEIAQVDASYGFHSAFFFVMNRYPVDMGLIRSLIDRGYEVGVHGYNHDGKLLCMRKCPVKRFFAINQFAEEIGANSFRSPMTLRDPRRMQNLGLPYDLSFFDTDPFEPMPGGTMSVFPFHMGKLLELPYTLAQDYTILELLKETNSNIWKQKVKYLQSVNGMMLLDTHPDYLKLGNNLDVYREFLDGMQMQTRDLFCALPSEVGAWWQERTAMIGGNISGRASITRIIKDNQTQTLSFIL